MSQTEHPDPAQSTEATIARDSAPPASLNSFPTEFIRAIYPLLELKDAIRLSLTCKRFYAILAPETCRDQCASRQFADHRPADLAAARLFWGDVFGVDRFKDVDCIEISSDLIEIATESGLLGKLRGLREIRLNVRDSDNLLSFFELFGVECSSPSEMTTVQIPADVEPKIERFSCNNPVVAFDWLDRPLFRPKVVQLACNPGNYFRDELWFRVWKKVMRLESVSEIEVYGMPTTLLAVPVAPHIAKLYFDHLSFRGISAEGFRMVENNLVACSKREGTSIEIEANPTSRYRDLTPEQLKEMGFWRMSEGLMSIAVFPSSMTVPVVLPYLYELPEGALVIF